MSKTKELLANLNKITDSSGVGATKSEPKVRSYTNRFYTSTPESIHKLPKKYEKAKRMKDEDGDEYIMIDRIYGNLWNEGELLQANGALYKGKLYKKRRLITNVDPITRESKNFYSRCNVTADGRWFDNGGLPIEAPTELEPEKVKTKEELEEEQREKVEKLKRKEAEILANLK
jgi:hypothetical protein